MTAASIRPLELDAIVHVARNMREADRREIAATRWHFDPAQIARETFALARFGSVAWCAAGGSDMPAAVLALVEYWPGFYSAGLYATPEWPKVALTLTRWVRRSLVPDLLSAGAHRVECRALAEHRQAHRWLARLGAECEAVLPDMGRDREAFCLYAWRLSDFRKSDLEKSHVPSRTFQQPKTAAASGPSASASTE